MEPLNTYKTSIKNWALEDRPREKLLLKGKNALSNSELLAILISTGTKKKSAMDLAREILESCGNDLNALAQFTLKELMRFEGIGEAKAVTIASAIELGGRRQMATVLEKKKIGASRDAYELMRGRIADLEHEEFWILFLNRAHRVIGIRKMSEGGFTGTVADPKRIYKTALEEKAAAIIACHNHPSGSTTPSISDNKLTEKIKQAGLFLDITLLDHLIISQSGYYSYADSGRL